MRTMLKMSLGAALVVAAIGFAPAAYAFHDGGVAECEGCHTMHNSEGGKAVRTYGNLKQFQSGPFLLQGNTQSEACLNCHNSPSAGSYHISTDDSVLLPGAAPVNYTAGGDFGWLKKSYHWLIRSPSTFGDSFGQDHGHNIVAPAFNFLADTTRTVGPGGTFPAANLQCSSCHDPHGKYRQDANGVQTTTGLPILGSGSYNTSAPTATAAVGVYRLLGGDGYLSSNAPAAFKGPSPSAVAATSQTYNKVETDNLAGQVRVAYGKNMSEWCANCHGSILTTGYMSGQAGFTHPAGATAKFGTAELANYASYVKSGTLGTPVSSYWTLAPFEIGTTVLADLQAAQKTLNGPDASSNVACVSCHRAHASGFDSMLRFNTTYEMITDGTGASGAATYAGTAAIGQGRTEAEMTAAYYGRPATVFSSYQRDLCNKCHAKD
jgi:hypothetical protein